jgi:hypothetical protein
VKILFFSRAWGKSGLVQIFIFFDGSARIFSSAVSGRCRGQFWSWHGAELENETIRDAAGTQRARFHRFTFHAGFYVVFQFTLQHLRLSILNFRDDFSAAAAAGELTTWNLIHRAGPAPLERAPRPSSSRTGFSLSVFRSTPKTEGYAEDFLSGLAIKNVSG